MKFEAIRKSYLDGTLTEDRLKDEGVTPGDFIKLRTDEQDSSTGFAYAKSGEGEGRKRKYVFVTESAIGWTKDLPLADSWDFKEFRQRQAPVLYHHDSYAGPIGSAFGIKKNQDYKGTKAVTGSVTFAPEGLSKTADFAFGMVEAGMLNGGSVGFTVHEMREPTPAETRKFKLGDYSAVFTKSSLTEFSVLGVGRDPLAGVVYSADGQSELESFISENPDRFDPEVVREFREYQYTGEWKAPKKIMVQVDTDKADEPTKEEALNSALQAFGLDSDGADEVTKVASSRMEANQVRVVTNQEWAEVTERLAALEAIEPVVEPEVNEDPTQYSAEDMMEMSLEDLDALLNLETAQGGDE